MKTAEEAIQLIGELVIAECAAAREAHTRKKGVSQSTNKREMQAVSAVFKALTGRKPTLEEIIKALP